VDGDEVNVRCSLEATVVEGGGEDGKHCLGVMVEEVSFKSHRSHDDELNCVVQLVTGKKGCTPKTQASSTINDNNNKNILFSPKSNDICHMLRYGSKFNVAFTARPKISHNNEDDNNTKMVEHTSTRLGAINLKWIPISLPIAANIKFPSHHRNDDNCRNYHGPLPIPNLHPIRLDGPVCYVESTPFRASRRTIPPIPKVACPFEVRYKVVNRTEMHQKIRIAMNEGGGILGGGGDTDGAVLVSGIIGGEMNLGPMESKEFSYLMLFTTVGRSTMPTLHVSSMRYGTWIIHGDTEESIFVTP